MTEYHSNDIRNLFTEKNPPKSRYKISEMMTFAEAPDLLLKKTIKKIAPKIIDRTGGRLRERGR
jgi:hypothetical protein